MNVVPAGAHAEGKARYRANKQAELADTGTVVPLREVGNAVKSMREKVGRAPRRTFAAASKAGMKHIGDFEGNVQQVQSNKAFCIITLVIPRAYRDELNAVDDVTGQVFFRAYGPPPPPF